jgi:hypothetical protein
LVIHDLEELNKLHVALVGMARLLVDQIDTETEAEAARTAMAVVIMAIPHDGTTDFRTDEEEPGLEAEVPAVTVTRNMIVMEEEVEIAQEITNSNEDHEGIAECAPLPVAPPFLSFSFSLSLSTLFKLKSLFS